MKALSRQCIVAGLMFLVLFASVPVAEAAAAKQTLEELKQILSTGTKVVLKRPIGGVELGEMLKDSPKAQRALIALLSSASEGAEAGQTAKKLISGTLEGLRKIKAFNEPGGTQKVIDFLEKFEDLHEWAKSAPGQLDELNKVCGKFSSGRYSDSIGAAYELRVAQKRIANLSKLQPGAGGSDAKLFRDLQLNDGTLVEAKNYRLISELDGQRALTKQVDSHFRRLAQAGEGFNDLKPLAYFFNRATIPTSWGKAVKDRAVSAIMDNFPGTTEAQAKAWVSQKLTLSPEDF